MRNFNLLLLLFLFVTPFLSAQERGIASYYSDSFQGRKTASGEKYDKTKMTGAHKTLPFGTLVRVTRVDNGQSVKIRINDLGPYISGRIIELSGKAGELLGLYEDGVAEVTVDVIGKTDLAPPPEAVASNRGTTAPATSLPPTPTLNKGTTAKAAINPPPPPRRTNQPAPTDNKLVEKGPKAPRSYDRPVVEVPKVTSTTRPVQVAPKSSKAVSPKAGAAVLSMEPAGSFKAGHTYKFSVDKTAGTMYGVQVAAVKDIDGMMQLVTKYQGMWFDEVFVHIENGKDGKPVYKLILGAFAERDKAENYKRSMKKRKKIDGFVVEM